MSTEFVYAVQQVGDSDEIVIKVLRDKFRAEDYALEVARHYDNLSAPSGVQSKG